MSFTQLKLVLVFIFVGTLELSILEFRNSRLFLVVLIDPSNSWRFYFGAIDTYNKK